MGLQSRRIGLLAAVFFGLALAGCDVFRKTKECGLLSKTVAAWMAEAPAPDQRISGSERIARDARATARRYEDLDRRLSALNIQSDELVARVARYRNMAVSAARVLDEVALALDSENTLLARTRRVEFDNTVQAERALVAEINAVCRK